MRRFRVRTEALQRFADFAGEHPEPYGPFQLWLLPYPDVHHIWHNELVLYNGISNSPSIEIYGNGNRQLVGIIHTERHTARNNPHKAASVLLFNVLISAGPICSRFGGIHGQYRLVHHLSSSLSPHFRMLARAPRMGPS